MFSTVMEKNILHVIKKKLTPFMLRKGKNMHELKRKIYLLLH